MSPSRPRPSGLPRLLLAAYLLVAGGALAAAETAGGAPEDSGGADVLVRVNGEPITEAQVLRRLRAVDPDVEVHRDTPNRWSRLMESATEAEIRDRLLLQAARAEGLEAPPEELDAALARSRELLGEERYAKMLADRGASEADYRAFLGDRILIDNYGSKIAGEIAIDDETLRDYYRGHKASFKAPARARLEAVETGDRALAERAAERLEAGETPAALSDLDSGVRVRDAWVNERDLPEDVRKQVESGEAGDVLGPFEFEGRFRVIRVRERQPSRRLSYGESRALIRERLLGNREQAALDAWYEQAKRKARIEYP